LGQPVTQASALACKGRVCRPIAERKKRKTFLTPKGNQKWIAMTEEWLNHQANKVMKVE